VVRALHLTTEDDANAVRQKAALVFTERNSGKERGAMNGHHAPGGFVRGYVRYITSYILTAMGVFVTLGTVISRLTGESLRHWTQAYSLPIFIAWVTTLLLTVPALKYMGRQCREQERSIKLHHRVSELSDGAAALFEILTFLGPEPVDESLLRPASDIRAPTEVLQRIVTDPDYLRRALAELSGISLAEFDQATRKIRVRRIELAIARSQLSMENPALAQGLGKLVQSILAASDPGVPDRDDAEEIYRQSRKHLITSGAILSSDSRVRQLVIHQIRRLYRAGSYTEAVALGFGALSYWREAFGSNDRQTLALAVEVGWAWRRLGRWEEAIRLNRDTLERLKSRFGTDDKYYLLCARSDGIDMALLGDYGKALENDLQLLPSHRRVLGPVHLETLQLRSEIAIILRCLGRFGEALEHDRYTVAQRQVILGDEDTSTLISQFAIARDLRMLGQIHEAYEILDGIRSILAGKPFVSRQFELLTESELALSLRSLGRYPEALARGEAVLRKYHDVFGPEHRETLRAGINFINDLRIAGRLHEARNLGERIVASLTAIVGADHPNTLAAQANLASVLRAEGHPEASLRIDEHVAAKFTTLLGEAHPHTLAVRTNIASDLAMTGQTDRACEVGERSYHLHVATRGHHHPATLATAANLARDRHPDGDHVASERVTLVIEPAMD
jgi:tetratricopeptide (TPR) repeat protein